MRQASILGIVATALLAACSEPEQADRRTEVTSTVAASEAKVADQTSATAQQPKAVTADSKTEPSMEVQEGQDEVAPTPAIRYTCENGKTAIAHYVESGAGVQRLNLEVGGQEYGLGQAMSASGARYETDSALPSGRKLVWWSKGNSAMLIEHDPQDAEGDSDLIVNCKEASKR